MSLKNDKFPSSAAFDLINDSLTSDKAEQKKAVEQVKSIFAFTLSNDKGETESWYLDLKENGVVGKGTAPEGKKATATLILSDANFQKMVNGANATNMFMSGDLQIKGDMMKAMKLEPVLKRARAAAPKL